MCHRCVAFAQPETVRKRFRARIELSKAVKRGAFGFIIKLNVCWN